VSSFILVISTILLFASFLSFSISVVDGYLLVAFMQCSSILLRYLVKDSSLQLFISSFLFPYSLGLLISANLFIKKSYFFQEDILSNKYIKKTAIIISFLLFINFLIKTYASTFSTDDLLGQTNFALSTQSPIFYSVQGIITLYCNAYLFFIFLIGYRNKINKKINFLFLIVIPSLFSFIQGIMIALKVSIYAYLTKAVLPILRIFELYFLNPLRWKKLNIKRFIFKSKFSFSKLKLLLFILSSGLAIIFLIGIIFNSNLLDSIFFKIFVRAEGYGQAFANLDMLYDSYKFNFLYFLHPFLKLIGSQGYEAPMGTFLDSGGNPENWIGGPNIHFPLVIRILSGGPFLGFILNFFFAFMIGYFLAKSRNILTRIDRGIKSNSIFSSIVFFQCFPLLFIEPSAWTHSIFFLSLVIIIIRLLNLFYKPLHNLFFFKN